MAARLTDLQEQLFSPFFLESSVFNNFLGWRMHICTCVRRKRLKTSIYKSIGVRGSALYMCHKFQSVPSLRYCNASPTRDHTRYYNSSPILERICSFFLQISTTLRIYWQFYERICNMWVWPWAWHWVCLIAN